MFLWIALRRIIYIVTSSTKEFLYVASLYIWDFILVILNIIIPDYSRGKVISNGRPGHGGLWPQYIAPQAGDSRSPCPGLNALANHGEPTTSLACRGAGLTVERVAIGILPRDGKNIKFADLPVAIRRTYNMSHPFSILLPRQAAQLLNRDPGSDSFDLSDLSVHNMIEHDASFVRTSMSSVGDKFRCSYSCVTGRDIYYDVTQAAPASPVVSDLLALETETLAAADMSNFLGKRRVQCRKDNPQFSLSLGQKFIGSTKCVCSPLCLHQFPHLTDHTYQSIMLCDIVRPSC